MPTTTIERRTIATTMITSKLRSKTSTNGHGFFGPKSGFRVFFTPPLAPKRHYARPLWLPGAEQGPATWECLKMKSRPQTEVFIGVSYQTSIVMNIDININVNVNTNINMYLYIYIYCINMYMYMYIYKSV